MICLRSYMQGIIKKRVYDLNIVKSHAALKLDILRKILKIKMRRRWFFTRDLNCELTNGLRNVFLIGMRYTFLMCKHKHIHAHKMKQTKATYHVWCVCHEIIDTTICNTFQELWKRFALCCLSLWLATDYCFCDALQLYVACTHELA